MSEADISRLMVGRDVVLKIEKEDPTVGKTVLKIRNLVKNSASGKRVLDDVSFDIHEARSSALPAWKETASLPFPTCWPGWRAFPLGLWS